MKKQIITLLISIISLQTFAQQEGMIRFTRTTYWTKLNSTLTYLSKQEKEKQAYMFGGRDEGIEYTLLYFNEKGSYYTQSDQLTSWEEKYDYSGRKEVFGIKRDFEKGYFDNVGKTIGGNGYNNLTQFNSLSIKVIYFLDYLTLKNKWREKRK